MAEGRIEVFNGGEGYGFIEANQGLGLFVPFRAFEEYGSKSVNERERACFTKRHRAEGPQTAWVRNP